ncbi:ABC transporter ATP-binding protein [Profundibacter sp.]
MLRWENINHRFGLTDVLEDINITVEKGHVLSLVGPSGCGKSTLLNIAADLLEPTEGVITNTFERLAIVFQEHRLLPWRRAIDNIAYGLKARGVGRDKRHQTAQRLGHRMGLDDDDLTKFPHELSGGMRQRVSLARALAIEPDLLLLDEPFTALDVGLRRDLQDLVISLINEHGLSGVFVTHDLSEAVRLSDEIVVLAPDPGRIVYRQQITLPSNERDETYVFRAVGELMQVPAVDAAFRIDEKAA